jgi:hypothetical protein
VKSRLVFAEESLYPAEIVATAEASLWEALRRQIRRPYEWPPIGCGKTGDSSASVMLVTLPQTSAVSYGVGSSPTQGGNYGTQVHRLP